MFVVTGLGHSGTGWASRLFTRLGVPCGHEQWFNPWRHVPGGPDSSWLAVPYLDRLPDGWRIVHLVRDPLRVAQSYARQHNERDHRGVSPWYVFAETHRPDLFAADTMIGRVIDRVAGWDAALLGRGDVHRVRIEDCRDPRVAADMVEYATGWRPATAAVAATLRALGDRVNAHLRHRPDVLTAADVRGTAVEQRAVHLGYGSY